MKQIKTKNLQFTGKTAEELDKELEKVGKIRDVEGIKPCFGHTIRIQNTGGLFYCDNKDWQKAIACKWSLTDSGRLVNPSGVFFEDYVGIVGIKKPRLIEPMDFSRCNYY
jgi:hypothetical protein